MRPIHGTPLTGIFDALVVARAKVVNNFVVVPGHEVSLIAEKFLIYGKRGAKRELRNTRSESTPNENKHTLFGTQSGRYQYR